MKSEMNEAARLTREGRLAEATALIQRSLGMRSLRTPAPARFVEVPAIDVAASVVNEPATAEASEASGAEKDSSSAQAETEPRSPLHRTPHAMGAMFGGLPMPGTPGKLPARGRSGRRFSPDVIAPAGGQWLSQVYTGEEGSRAYKHYLPSSYHGQILPLVVMLHGCTQSADDFAAGTRMNFVAEAEGLLVVYPEQTVTANNLRCWNWFQPADQQRGRGEPAIIAGITSEVMAEHNVDRNRVYVAGISAGGAMAAILATTYTDLFAAAGVHSGLAPGKAHDLPSALQVMQGRGLDKHTHNPSRSTPLILFHGDRDSTVHPRNAEEFIRQWVGVSDSQPSLRRDQVLGGRAHSCAAYQDRGGRTLVERWTIHGAGHAWSGGSVNGSFTDPEGPSASQEMVRFFREHPHEAA